MRLTYLTIPAMAVLVAACSTGGSQTAPPTNEGPTTRVEVQLTDAFRIELSSATVPAGVPVTFVVTNTGVVEHEFYLGDEAVQAAHEQEMLDMGGMTHDDPEGIPVKPGETRSLTYTFPVAGKTIAGCHVAGHYGAGMRTEIIVGG